MSTLGIYVHVPFCGKKCGYCDFYSVCYTKEQAELYVEAVLRNIRHYADKSRAVDTVYFGGGTPSLLTAEQLGAVIAEIRGRFALDPNAEVTIEANPNTLTPDKLAGLRNAGINRLSVGVQSMSDAELRLLGRSHTAERAARAVLDAADAGFRNISCDLMLGIPSQTPDSLAVSIARLPIQHVSAYILKIEEGTPFDCGEVRASLPDEDTTAELYLLAVRELDRHGFAQYEVSNFAKPGFECRHNVSVWRGDDYIGLGDGAHGREGLRRTVGKADGAYDVTEFSPEADALERALFALRMAEGIDLADVARRWPILAPRQAAWQKELRALVREGIAREESEGRFTLTDRGFEVCDSVVSSLFERKA